MSEIHTLAMTAMKEKGTADALDLRGRAADLDGTAVIAEEEKAPDFVAGKDYSRWPAGAPVRGRRAGLQACSALRRGQLAGPVSGRPARSVEHLSHQGSGEGQALPGSRWTQRHVYAG